MKSFGSSYGILLSSLRCDSSFLYGLPSFKDYALLLSISGASEVGDLPDSNGTIKDHDQNLPLSTFDLFSDLHFPPRVSRGNDPSSFK